MPGTITLMATLFGAAGCATSQEMATWRAHSTHFASGSHAFFSLRNDTWSRPDVTRRISGAHAEAWWGDPVTVNSDEVLAGR
jgi:hypothetical protein